MDASIIKVEARYVSKNPDLGEVFIDKGGSGCCVHSEDFGSLLNLLRELGIEHTTKTDRLTDTTNATVKGTGERVRVLEVEEPTCLIELHTGERRDCFLTEVVRD